MRRSGDVELPRKSKNDESANDNDTAPTAGHTHSVACTSVSRTREPSTLGPVYAFDAVNRQTQPVPCLLILCVAAAVPMSCTPFGGPSSSGSGSSDGGSELLEGGSVSPDGGPFGDGGIEVEGKGGMGYSPSRVNKLAFCAGATFCDTFDHGGIDALRNVWGSVEHESDLSLLDEAGVLRANRILRASPVNTPVARVVHALGSLASGAEIIVKLDVLVPPTNPSTPDHELMTLDFRDTNRTLIGDYPLRINGGKLDFKAVQTNAEIADGLWHRIEAHVQAGSYWVALDGKAFPAAPFTRSMAYEFEIGVGVYGVNASITNTIDFDNVRVDLP